MVSVTMLAADGFPRGSRCVAERAFFRERDAVDYGYRWAPRAVMGELRRKIFM